MPPTLSDRAKATALALGVAAALILSTTALISSGPSFFGAGCPRGKLVGAGVASFLFDASHPNTCNSNYEGNCSVFIKFAPPPACLPPIAAHNRVVIVVQRTNDQAYAPLPPSGLVTATGTYLNVLDITSTYFWIEHKGCFPEKYSPLPVRCVATPVTSDLEVGWIAITTE
jgi:hypothetical protein